MTVKHAFQLSKNDRNQFCKVRLELSHTHTQSLSLSLSLVFFSFSLLQSVCLDGYSMIIHCIHLASVTCSNFFKCSCDVLSPGGSRQGRQEPHCKPAASGRVWRGVHDSSKRTEKGQVRRRQDLIYQSIYRNQLLYLRTREVIVLCSGASLVSMLSRARWC